MSAVWTPARRPFSVRVVALSGLTLFLSSTTFAEQDPRGAPADNSVASTGQGPAYGLQNESTVRGTVVDVKTGGPGPLGWMMRSHTLGLGHRGTDQTLLLVRTDKETIRIHVGPTAYVGEQHVQIKKGDTIEVIGANVTLHGSRLILTREIRNAGHAWVLRDATGQPLWPDANTESRRFWTKKKILFLALAAKAMVIVKLA
jgi:hypothetical protein